jgi:hypothetical protein
MSGFFGLFLVKVFPAGLFALCSLIRSIADTVWWSPGVGGCGVEVEGVEEVVLQ